MTLEPPPARTGHTALLPLLFALALVLPGCATQQGAQTEESTDERSTSEPQPGSREWDEAARRLPAGAPMVQVFRVSSLLEMARSLRAWLVDQPDMFGPEGERYVERAQGMWAGLQRRLGFDPLAAGTPGEVGIDADRPLMVAAHPARATGADGAIRAFESSLVEASGGDDDGESAVEIVRAMADGEGTPPSGLHTKLTEELDEANWRMAYRALLPVADRSTVADTVENVFSTLDYEPLPASDLGDGERLVRAYYRRQASRPAVVVRIGADWAVVDILSNPYLPPAVGEEGAAKHYRRALGQLVDDEKRGRPDAPAPPRTPAAAVAVDQRGMTRLAKVRGYAHAMATSGSASVDRRDTAFVDHLRDAGEVARSWRVAADRLSGTTFSFYGPDSTADGRFFRFAVDLYGPRRKSAFEETEIDPTLDVEDRALGFGVDFAPFFSETWYDWLGVETDELLDEPPSSESASPLRILSFPRQLVLRATSAGRLLREDDSSWFAPIAPHASALRRLELASSGRQIRTLRGDPSFVGLLALDPNADESTIEGVLEALPASIQRLAEESTDEDATDDEGSDAPALPGLEAAEGATETPSLKRESLVKLGPSDQASGPPIYYYIPPADETPYVFFSFGIDREAVEEELDDLDESGPAQSPDVAYARLEPATLFSAMTAFDSDAFEPVDVGILAQRIGPFEWRARPHRESEFQRLSLEFSVRRPPEL